jgi:hypothetical protein
LRLALSNFARFGLESRLGDDLAASVEIALAHYARRLRSARKPVAPPAFLAGQANVEIATTVELALEPDTIAALKGEALRHHVSLEQVLSHAIFVYLADLDGHHAARPLGPLVYV